MDKRPELDNTLDAENFSSYYYLKEELAEFCKKEGLQSTGGKIELTDRIAYYLETGKKRLDKSVAKPVANISSITEESRIEPDFVCSEKHRTFFRQTIGKSFSFKVEFQKWLKANTGKTYKEAIEAYHQIIAEMKKTKTVIDKQFEYNTYIRDFFAGNSGKSLQDAITCWNYKKSIKGHNRYEITDLEALKR